MLEKMTGSRVTLSHISSEEKKQLGPTFLDFLDVVATSTGRSTYYDSKRDIDQVVQETHNKLFSIDKGIYSLGLALPGTTDYNRRIGILKLLSNPNSSKSILRKNQETEVILWLLDNIEPQRMLKTFNDLSRLRINNARARKAILRKILQNDKLPFWATKYKNAISIALTHAWGRRRFSIISNILSKCDCDISKLTDKENKIIKDLVDSNLRINTNKLNVYESICFIANKKMKFSNKYFRAFENAKSNLDGGSILHWTVLEGIRSTYHPDVPHSKVVELTANKSASTGDQMRMQKRAKKADVDVDFDPKKMDPIRLYIYAYEMGMNNKIRNALNEKAKKIASEMPISFSKIGIVLDNSASMYGNKDQKLKPVATSLAIRDTLVQMSEDSSVRTHNDDGKELPIPNSNTNLAHSLVSIFKEDPETVFIISDGYENAPAGRTAEVISTLRNIGYTTPIYHVNPVASTLGMKKLSDEAPALPVTKPEGLGFSIIRGAFELDPEVAVAGLMNMTFPKIGISEEKQ